jgi:hypothetical protein
MARTPFPAALDPLLNLTNVKNWRVERQDCLEMEEAKREVGSADGVVELE